jgi:hypothetical protein
MNNEQIFKTIEELLHKYGIKELEKTTTLQSLRMVSEEIDEFMISFSEKFNVDMSSYNYRNYFFEQVHPLIILKETFMRIVAPARVRKESITITHLIQVAQKGAWFEPGSLHLVLSMIDKQNAFNELVPLIERAKLWIINGGEDDFDIDEPFFEIEKKYGLDFSYSNALKSIYSLLDITIDSKSHFLKEVVPGYSYQHAVNDLDYILSFIKNGNIEDLESDIQFQTKIENLFH